MSSVGLIDIDLIGDLNSANLMLEYLERILSSTGMMAFLHLNVGPYIQSRTRDRFMSEGDDATGPWLPLSQSTVERRERMGLGGPGPINVRTGELEQWITQSQFMTSPHALGATLKYPGKDTGRKSLREKMATAQKGRVYPSTPPRPVLVLDERDLMYVVTTLAFFIQMGGGRV